MHTQGEHRRRGSDKLSVLVARELAAKRAGSARKRGKRVVITPAAGDDAKTPADASDDLADSDAEGPAGEAGKASQAPRGRRLLESDDEENDNNMDEEEINAEGSDGAAGKRSVKAAIRDGAGMSADESGSEQNDAGVGTGSGSGGSGSEPEDNDAAKSLARDAAAEAHDSGGSDAASESEEEVRSPPPGKKKRRPDDPRKSAKPASDRKEVVSDLEAAAGENRASPESEDSESDDDVPLLRGSRGVAAPVVAAVTEVVGAEAANGSVLPTEVQDQEDDDGAEEEVASGCKPAGDGDAAAVAGPAGKAGPSAVRETETRGALTASTPSVAAAAELAAAADDDAGGTRERSAAAATPDLGALARASSLFPGQHML